VRGVARGRGPGGCPGRAFCLGALEVGAVWGVWGSWGRATASMLPGERSFCLAALGYGVEAF
jgi:hypothetical protein